ELRSPHPASLGLPPRDPRRGNLQPRRRRRHRPRPPPASPGPRAVKRAEANCGMFSVGVMPRLSGRWAVAMLALAALPACRKNAGARAPAVTPLSLLPASTLVVISVDLARLRGAPLMAKLAAADPLPAPLLHLIAAFTPKTGVDP